MSPTTDSPNASPDPVPDHDFPCCRTRRQWLQTTLGLAVVGLAVEAEAGPEPAKAPPQVGDLLWFPSWEQNRAVSPDDLALNGAPLVVYPADPISGVIREKSRLNQVLLLKLDPATLDRTAQRYAVDGIIAYSGVCTHAACAVSEWKAEQFRMACPCHGSEYDLRQHANVVAGPAPRPLPMLRIELANRQFIVSGKFSGKVGLKKT